MLARELVNPLCKASGHVFGQISVLPVAPGSYGHGLGVMTNKNSDCSFESNIPTPEDVTLAAVTSVLSELEGISH